MDSVSEAPRLGTSEILEKMFSDYFVSGKAKQIVHKPELTLDFSRARLISKLLYMCSYRAMLCAFYRIGKSPDIIGDIDEELSLSTQ